MDATSSSWKEGTVAEVESSTGETAPLIYSPRLGALFCRVRSPYAIPMLSNSQRSRI